MIRIGLIGCGNYGCNLLRFLQRMPAYTVTALADSEPNRLEKAAALVLNDVFCTMDYRQLFPHVDAVIVAAPNHLHAGISIAAMEAGLPLYLEKPIATTLEDGLRIAGVQRRLGAKVMIGMQLRYGKVYRRAKELIDQGMVGRPVMAWYKEFRSPFLPGVGGWKIDPERNGGTIAEKNVHHFDLISWYLGQKPVSVMASGGSNAVYSGSGLLDNAIMVLDYDGGARACVGLSLFSAGCDDQIDFYIVGEKGVLTVGRDTVTITPNDAPDTKITVSIRQDLADMGHGGTEFDALNAFAALVERDEVPMTDMESGILTLATSLAAERSVREKRLVRIDEFLDQF